MLLIKVDNIEMPITQEGIFPLAAKYDLVVFCLRANRNPK
jgi:hypothetical protein